MKTCTRFITLICCYIFITGCGQPRKRFTEQEVVPYLMIYETYKLEYLNEPYAYDINIYFKDLEGNKAGECRIYSDGYREINLDSGFWSSFTDADREVLVLHELGHCDLELKHQTAPSIMQQFHLNGWTYMGNKEFYLEGLFDLQQPKLYDSIIKTSDKCHVAEEE